MQTGNSITSNPAIRSGKPIIRGTRLTVVDVLEYLAGGMTVDEVLSDFPEITRADIRACLDFASHNPTEQTNRLLAEIKRLGSVQK